MSEEPVSHLLRVRPPWRSPSSDKTECNRAANDVASIITREEARVMVNRLGKRRAAYSLCMACAEVHAPRSWWAAPDAVVARDVTRWSLGASEVADELRALGQLYEAHQEEFETLLAGVREGHVLEEARKAREERARAAAGPGRGFRPIRPPGKDDD